MKPKLSYSLAAPRRARVAVALFASTISAVMLAGAAREPADGARDETPTARADCAALPASSAEVKRFTAVVLTDDCSPAAGGSRKTANRGATADRRFEAVTAPKLQLEIAGYGLRGPRTKTPLPVGSTTRGTSSIDRPNVPQLWTGAAVTWKF